MKMFSDKIMALCVKYGSLAVSFVRDAKMEFLIFTILAQLKSFSY